MENRFGDNVESLANWVAQNRSGYVFQRHSGGTTEATWILHLAACHLLFCREERRRRKPVESIGVPSRLDLGRMVLGLGASQVEWVECDDCLGLTEILQTVRHCAGDEWSVTSRRAEPCNGKASIRVCRTVGKASRRKSEDYELEYSSEDHELTIRYGRYDCGPPLPWHAVQPALIIDLIHLRMGVLCGSLSTILSEVFEGESSRVTNGAAGFPPNRTGPMWD